MKNCVDLLEYKFKYQNNTLSLFQRKNEIFSNLLYYIFNKEKIKILLAKSKRFNKLLTLPSELKKIHKFEKSEEFQNINVQKITYFDSIQIKDVKKFQKYLLRNIDKFGGNNSIFNLKEKINKSCEKFVKSYKSTGFGTIVTLQSNDELDLISTFKITYIKGLQNNLIINYTIYPSDKFQGLFKQSLFAPDITINKLIFNSFKEVIKKKRICTGFYSSLKTRDYWINKVLDEINYQFKSKASNYLKYGFFNKNKNVLFPALVEYKYFQKQSVQLKDIIRKKFSILYKDIYINSDVVTSFSKFIDYSINKSFSIHLFLPNISEENRAIDSNEDLLSRSFSYIFSIAPFWLLLNIAAMQKQNLVDLRMKIISFLYRKQIFQFLYDMFIDKSVILEKQIIKNFINIQQIKDDFLNEMNIVQHEFKIPDLYNKEKRLFYDDLKNYLKYNIEDVIKTINEQREIFDCIHKNNILRMNISIQRLFLILSLIAVFITILQLLKNN